MYQRRREPVWKAVCFSVSLTAFVHCGEGAQVPKNEELSLRTSLDELVKNLDVEPSGLSLLPIDFDFPGIKVSGRIGTDLVGAYALQIPGNLSPKQIAPLEEGYKNIASLRALKAAFLGETIRRTSNWKLDGLDHSVVPSFLDFICTEGISAKLPPFTRQNVTIQGNVALAVVVIPDPKHLIGDAFSNPDIAHILIARYIDNRLAHARHVLEEQNYSAALSDIEQAKGAGCDRGGIEGLYALCYAGLGRLNDLSSIEESATKGNLNLEPQAWIDLARAFELIGNTSRALDILDFGENKTESNEKDRFVIAHREMLERALHRSPGN